MPYNNDGMNMDSRLHAAAHNITAAKKRNIKYKRLLDDYNKILTDLHTLSSGIQYPVLKYDIICTFTWEYKERLYLLNASDPYNKPVQTNNGIELLSFLSLPYRPEKKFSIVYNDLYKALVNLRKFNTDCMLQDKKHDKIISYYNSLRNVFFKYGLPHELRNAQKFLFIENSLFYFDEIQLNILTPNLIRAFYQNNIPKYALYEIKKALFKYDFKNITEKLPGIRYCFKNKPYGITYTNKHFTAYRTESLLEYHSPDVAVDFIDENQSYNQNTVRMALAAISASKLQGFRFWSELTVCAYTQETRGKIFLVYYEQANTVEPFMTCLESLFKNPYIICDLKTEDASNLLSYQATCNILGIINLDTLSSHKYELLTKMTSGLTVHLPGEISGWNTQYKNTMPLVVLINNKREFERLKGHCNKNNIVFKTLELNTAITLPDLTDGDLLYLKWCLISGYYHPQIKRDISGKTEDNVFKKFIDKFCTITGEEDDCYRSLEFYTDYVIPYYHANHTKEPGYKRFNKLLKNYHEGLIKVLPIHKSKSDNVQHILGLRFNYARYAQYMKRRVSSPDKESSVLIDYIDLLFDFIESDFNHICAAIKRVQEPVAVELQ